MTGLNDSDELKDSNVLSRVIAMRLFFYLVVIALFAFVNELWLSEPITDTRTAVFILISVSLIDSLAGILRQKPDSGSQVFEEPKNNLRKTDYQLSELRGAHRYDSIHHDTAAFIDAYTDNLLADGYYNAGTIENPFDSVMEVFLKEEGPNQEMVFLIDTEVFTMDLLLEHRYLFIAFIEELTQTHDRVWTKEISTVICVREMSVPLQILLSYKRHSETQNLEQPYQRSAHWSKAERAQVLDDIKIVAYVEEEKNMYTGAYQWRLYNDKINQWLRKYLLGTGYIEEEYVWKEKDWSDLFYLDYKNGILNGAFSYESVHHDHQEFTDRLADTLKAGGYESAGEIKNDLSVLLDVFVRRHQSGVETVLLMEADRLTMDVFHDHRYLLKEFLKKYLGETETNWEKEFRVVVSVKSMSPSLQTLLSVWPEFPYKNAAYVCAYVDEDKRLYTMAPWQEDGFYLAHEPWLSHYMPETSLQNPDHIWKDLTLSEIELPITEKEMNILIHKALNVARGEMKKAIRYVDGEKSRWEQIK